MTLGDCIAIKITYAQNILQKLNKICTSHINALLFSVLTGQL